MTNRKRKIIIALVMVVMVLPLICWLMATNISIAYGKWYYNKIKNNEKIFCYDTLQMTLNNAYYIDDLDYKDDLVRFYNDKLGATNNSSITFPIQTVSYKRQLFVLGYLPSDSSLVEIVDFDTTCWGFIRGYVYVKTISRHRPSRKLIRNHEDFLNSYTQNDAYKLQTFDRKKRNRISKYGLQCKCE